MDASELQALGKIEGRLGRMEALQEANVRTNAELSANVNRLVDKLERSDDTAKDAEQRARSAHHRIDETIKKVDEIRAHYDGEIRALYLRIEAEARGLDARIKQENQERKTDRRWMIGTMMSAAGLVVAAIKLF